MNLRWLYVVLLSLVAVLVNDIQLHATSGLKIAPLEYRAQIDGGEEKKGFIDISNPTGHKLKIKTDVQGFRQINDQGSLEFFDDEQLSAGIKLDLDEFILGPRQAVRMYFLIDGTKLPRGDVYGAIWFKTISAEDGASIGQQIKLGTLLSLVNGTPGDRQAEISSLDVGVLQTDSSVEGSYTIRNLGDPQKSTGFYPEVSLSLWPFGESKQQASSLVFAGNERKNSFSLSSPPFGVYKIRVQYATSSQTKWVVVVRPVFIVSITIMLISVGTLLFILRHRSRLRYTGK